VLARHGLVQRRGRSRRRAQGTALSLGQRPNELCCTDYKGEFLLGNHRYCYPLTATDHASRYLLTCEALSSTKENYAFTVFERLFKERGLCSQKRPERLARKYQTRLLALSGRSTAGADEEAGQECRASADHASSSHFCEAGKKVSEVCREQLRGKSWLRLHPSDETVSNVRSATTDLPRILRQPRS
jgi:transposase InsO family protein